MTARLIDSCATYASAADILTAGYGTVTQITPANTGGRFSLGALTIAATPGTGVLQRTVSPGLDEWMVGFVARYSGQLATFISLREGATIHTDFRSDATDHITVTRNGTVLGTSTMTMATGTDYAFQLRVKIHDTLGTVTLYVNDVIVFNLTGLDTRNGGTGLVDTFYWTTAISQLSEVYIFDTAGSVNNAHPGSYRVQPRRATAAGNYAQWTPSASTNVSNVDDANGNDGDTTYNSSSTAAQKDSFQFGAISPTGGTVAGIMHRLVARKDDAGVRTIRPIQRQSATDYAGTTQTLTTAYAHYTEVKELNPSTGVAFTVAEMRATTPEFGYEIVA